MERHELDLANLPDEGDPLIWIRHHRDELAERYTSIDDLCDYYSQFSSVEAARAMLHDRVATQQALR